MFEEILQILKDKNVDVEDMFLEAYDNLGIKIEDETSQRVRIKKAHIDTESSLNSQQVNFLKES